MPAPRFRASYQVEIVDDSKLFLLNDDRSIVIDNPAAARVAQLLDGTREIPEIVVALSSEYSPQRVFTEITKLSRGGHLTTAPASRSSFTGYVESWGPGSDGFGQRAGDYCVTVVDLGEPSTAGALADALGELGVGTTQVVPLGSDGAVEGGVPAADLVVAVVDDYLDPRLAGLNAKMLANSQPWILAKPWGREVWVGPRMEPGTTGCWECAADRLTANRQVERYVAGKQGLTRPPVKPVGLLPGAPGIAAGLLSSEVFAICAGLEGALRGQLLTMDLTTMASDKHTLVRLPQCPACGTDPQPFPTDEVTLHPDRPEHRVDGGYRVCPPQETFNRLEHHISPYLGAVTRLERSSVGAEGITYAFTAGHNFGMMQDSMDLLKSNMRGQSGGKGRTEIQAKVSGVCEALERYCGVWTPHVAEVLSSFDEVSGRALHPQDLLGFSEQQYADRVAWNSDPTHRLHRIPEPFDESAPIAFTPAWSLTHGEKVLIPSGLVWFGSPDLVEHFYAVTDSNGGAAGNTLDEAILQGLCEVYERDAVALWWYNRVARPAVDLDSFQDGYIDTLRDYYDGMDRDIWVLDLSNDLSMSVFAAFSRRRHEVEDLMVGFGAHPDADIALFRALTELNQFLPFVANRDEQGNTIYGTPDPATLEWCRTATVETHAWVAPDPQLPAVTRDQLVRDLPADLGGIVRWCVDDLARAGMETLVVNQSRPDIDLAVAKVIVPGMRHFWRRMAPGRLYDVPVKLGWSDKPLTEDEMNPIGVFF